ncbi:class I SAM-dependent RNA methyltransferase [Hyphomicrobium sp. NDB2Meth4]|uniref:THUMP domain-containing class I SAM-dependent RNA methyltransferase n=1 Tax=Hyphomicrobium sp. NDB2Meth4 TaxID=1892846 RepID=UPI000A7EA083|nr:class I SAM-dependent RNA methyltransferase [Hyphomicrobium sp. NDB2Meth4]
MSDFEIFLVATPGLEGPLCAEARANGFKAKTVAGGVALKGGWSDVWRANLQLRGPTRIMARIDSFHVTHLSQLDKRARRVPWHQVLKRNKPFRVEASCKSSKIYHSGAAAQRIERAIVEELGAQPADDAAVCIKVRIEDDLCTISVDTSGESLHKRGHKQAVAKAPMRETMAAMFLRQCGFDGTQPVLDPMCGSGTFVIEAAEIASGLQPGRSRKFAFEDLASFEPKVWQSMRAEASPLSPSVKFYGSDLDPGAIRMCNANAERAGVAAITEFHQCGVEELTAPEGPPGIVIVNPPYGDRIGQKGPLRQLYRSLGQTLLTRFSGWRVGLITNEAKLAEATGLPFSLTAEPVLHGGLRITLFRTGPLP